MIRQASAGYVAALHRRPGVTADGTAIAGLWHRLDADPPDHVDRHPGLVAEAIVNDGRWVVTCPCGGAQLARRGVDRFFCLDCAGESHDSLWVPVVFPAEADAIERTLAPRPLDKQRWEPGDSVEQLRAENEILGVN